LPVNVAAALAVMIPLIGGIVFLFLERKDRFVRFYCIQSIVLGVLLGAAELILKMVQLIFEPLWAIGVVLYTLAQYVYAIFALIWLVFYFVALVQAFRGKMWALPYLGPMAKRYLAAQAP
jgi:uncharacterized membrane protein